MSTNMNILQKLNFIHMSKSTYVKMSFINLRFELTGLAVFNILIANLSMLRWASPNREKASLAAGCGSLTPMAENTSPNPKLKYNLYYIIKLFHIYQTPNWSNVQEINFIVIGLNRQWLQSTVLEGSTYN